MAHNTFIFHHEGHRLRDFSLADASGEDADLLADKGDSTRKCATSKGVREGNIGVRSVSEGNIGTRSVSEGNGAQYVYFPSCGSPFAWFSLADAAR